MAFSNEFSYSNSRNEKFREGCLRRYYLHYYGSWNGWNSGATDLQKKAYFYKKLTGRYAWAGKLLHEAIAKMLTAFKSDGTIIPPEELKTQAREQMKVQWKESQERVASRNAKLFGLREHEFRHKIKDSDWQKIRDRVFNSIDSFYNSDLFEEILAIPTEDWLYIDNNNFDTFTVKVNGKLLPVYSIPDFAMRKPDGKVVIFDWKTGKPKATHKSQLALYALYATKFWNVKPEDVEVVLFYSEAGNVVREFITNDDIRSASDDIKTFLNDIIVKLESKDIAKNSPVKSDDGKDDLSLWPLTDNTNNCFWCDFENICGIREKINI